ncbi:MAG TPA: signal peptidase I [Anaerolineales bacterium]|nr:signal peptidase I [Anaerolineales bacterium]
MENELNKIQGELNNDEEQQHRNKSGIARFLIDVIETIVLSILLFLGINAVTARIRVDGFSMEPTMNNGEFVLVNRLAYKLGAPELGDVIVFHFPVDPEQEYIKRVIGLPGDQVVVANNQVTVNDAILNEPYIAAPPNYQGSWIVPEEHLFVLGDNRNNSSDSHSWGPVPMTNVVGKAVFVYWPFSDLGLVDHVNPALQLP